jgi:hypothetical protein
MPVAASGKPKDTVVPACVFDDLRERMRGRFPQEKSDQGDDYYLDVVKAMICIVKMSDLSVKSENQFQLDLRSATESGRPRRRPGGESGPLKVALRKDTGMVGITGSVRILGAFKGICTWKYFFTAALDGYRGLLECVNDQDGTLKHVSNEYAKEWLDANLFANLDDTLGSMIRQHEKDR